MQIARSNSLAVRITVVVLMASSIALGLLVAALLVFDRISAQALLESRLATLADVVGQTSTAALEFNDKPAAIEVLQALRQEPPVMMACLYDVGGQFFAEYQRDWHTGTCPARRTELQPAGRRYCNTVRQVFRNEELVGTLFVQSDMQDAERRGLRLLLVACFLALLALAAGGLAGSLLQRAISIPIFALVRAMNEVTEQQKFSTRVQVSGSDEITLLGRGFNHMLSELEQRDEKKNRAEAKLRELARTDALTGLPNRRLFTEQLGQSLASAKRESRTLGLLYVDLDGFKLVNDSLGHTVGDQLLCAVGDRLQARVRKSDILARLGGDEFTVILIGLKHQDDAALVADGLLNALSVPFRVDDHEITIGASIGISIFPAHATEADDLMRQADSAMYAAKRSGKNQAMYFRAELGLLVRERHNLENELRGAIGRGEIEVHYQPEFDASSTRLIRFEALARWFHPRLGLIPPGKFVPIAEECGLITSLGQHVLEKACREALRWQTLVPHPVQVAVNLSSIQFHRESIVEEVAEVLQRTGLNPKLLQLELTETVMLGPMEHSVQKLRRLREMGISLAIDDFGTGYSCLGYLPSLSFDTLKIDRSFVKDLETRRETVTMVRSLVGLAHGMGMRVIVEGIEDQRQYEVVRRLGANEVQGYLFGRPTADPASNLLRSLKKDGNKPAVSEEDAAALNQMQNLAPTAERARTQADG